MGPQWGVKGYLPKMLPRNSKPSKFILTKLQNNCCCDLWSNQKQKQFFPKTETRK